jgi:hypothetical protein
MVTAPHLPDFALGFVHHKSFEVDITFNNNPHLLLDVLELGQGEVPQLPLQSVDQAEELEISVLPLLGFKDIPFVVVAGEFK